MTQKFIVVEVVSYDEGTDQFHITQPVIELSDPEHAPGCMNDMFDGDDSKFDAGLFAHLVGQFDEPSEFVGKRFKLLSAYNALKG